MSHETRNIGAGFLLSLAITLSVSAAARWYKMQNEALTTIAEATETVEVVEK